METYAQILYILISIIYFIFFILTLTRWILLLKRIKQLLHQKIFFFLIWLFFLSRFITLLLFTIPKIGSNYESQLNQSLGFETNLLVTAFLLIVFTLNQIRIKKFTENYDNEKKKKKIFISIFIIIDIILISIHIWLVFYNYQVSRWFICLSFVIVSIGFLIYSVKLSKNSEYQKQSKKFLIIFVICTICFLIRIPILIMAKVKADSFTKEQIYISYIVYLIITELIPVSLITFSMFSVPIKPKQANFYTKKFITLLLFTIPKIDSNYSFQLNQSLEIETNALVTAFLLIIFTLNQIRIKKFTENYDNEKKKKKIFISIFIIIDIILISIHIWLVFYNYQVSTWFLCLSFIIVSIGFLIYSVKLSKNSEYPKQSKKFLIIFVICTICFLIRIPILIIWKFKKGTITREQTDISYTVYLIISELIPVGLITFSMFSVPIKPIVMNSLDLKLLKTDYD
ncbi:hypothetical protein M0811_10884 [Anaeramoeba ignava]|uniref:Uncharacterized protein n=1 Tax=Anaeramoeba ignava TaxID=1746090 RepID=A0A9Q0LCL5_ANAIG|nr:hypothetical protein M0811_10884 [Anaeramoeba ignava]